MNAQNHETEFAVTIKRQIGVNTFSRVGARDFVYSATDRYLRFAVTGRRGWATAIKVTLEPNDTYTVNLERMNKRTFDFEVVRTLELVYCDQLAEVVESLYIDGVIK